MITAGEYDLAVCVSWFGFSENKCKGVLLLRGPYRPSGGLDEPCRLSRRRDTDGLSLNSCCFLLRDTIFPAPYFEDRLSGLPGGVRVRFVESIFIFYFFFWNRYTGAVRSALGRNDFFWIEGEI